MKTTLSPLGAPAMEPLPGVHREGFAVKTFRRASVDSHWHFHPELELAFIQQGNGVLHAGRSLTPYRAGDLFPLGSNLPHAYGSHPRERNGAVWTVMHFAPERCREFWLLPQNQRLKSLFARSVPGLHFRGEGVARAAPLLQRLEKRAPGDVAMALWIELLERLARVKDFEMLDPSVQAEAPPFPVDPRLQQVLTGIDDQIEHPDLTQASVARTIGLSPQAFCRFFRERTGRPFHRYVNELRIAHACSALVNTEKSVSEVAFHAGFNNLANFNRRFRELMRQTPSQYRKTRGGFQ